MFWEKENRDSLATLLPAVSSCESVMFLVGPEGGFSENEIKIAATKGFKTVSLGKRIMRAETASFAAMTLLQYLVGNLDRDYE